MTVTTSKRIVTFILCLVFCFMFVFPPMPAQAVVGVPALVAGGWAVGSEVIGSVIAALVMAATGVSFDCGYFGDTDNLSTMAYEQGYELVRDMILSGGNCAAWVDEVVGLFSISQGFKAGDKIEVPADVLEYTRNWVNENYDFSTGSVTVTSSGIFGSDGQFFEFSDYNSSDLGSVGSVFSCPFYSEVTSVDMLPITDMGNFYIRSGAFCDYSNNGPFQCYVGISEYKTGSWKGSVLSKSTTGSNVSSYVFPDDFVSEFSSQYFGCLAYDVDSKKIYLGSINLGKVSWSESRYINFSISDSYSSESFISGSDALNTAHTENQIISVPDVAMGDISGYSVPAVQQLTGDMVLPAPGAGEVEGDNDDTNIGDLTPDKPFYVPDTWTGFNSWIKSQSENFKAWRDTIGTSIDNLVDDVTGIGANVNDWITEKWGDFTDTVEGIPDAIATSIENIIASVIDVLSQPAQKFRDKFDNVLNKILPFFQGVGNLGLSFLGIWHYVITWVGTLAPWISTMFMIWNGLPYAMVVPIYATAAVVIVIGIYRRFFM